MRIILYANKVDSVYVLINGHLKTFISKSHISVLLTEKPSLSLPKC